MESLRTPEHAERVRHITSLARTPLVVPLPDPRVVTDRDRAGAIARATRTAALNNLDAFNRGAR